MNVLLINSSGRSEQSVSRRLVQEVVHQLKAHHSDVHVTNRDVSTSLPFVNDLMISGFYIPDEQRTAEQRQALAFSDELVQELKAADVIVIGAPIYNFSIPASLKTYFDLVCRSGLTFRATPTGLEGLLKGKKAYAVVTSGGVAIGSAADLATPYLRVVLGFVGITDLELIGADRLSTLGEVPISQAREAIEKIKQIA